MSEEKQAAAKQTFAFTRHLNDEPKVQSLPRSGSRKKSGSCEAAGKAEAAKRREKRKLRSGGKRAAAKQTNKRGILV